MIACGNPSSQGREQPQFEWSCSHAVRDSLRELRTEQKPRTPRRVAHRKRLACLRYRTLHLLLRNDSKTTSGFVIVSRRHWPRATLGREYSPLKPDASAYGSHAEVELLLLGRGLSAARSLQDARSQHQQKLSSRRRSSTGLAGQGYSAFQGR